MNGKNIRRILIAAVVLAMLMLFSILMACIASPDRARPHLLVLGISALAIGLAGTATNIKIMLLSKAYRGY